MRVTEELRKPGVKRMILDTDTYNEIDDQFALSLAMLAPDKIDLDCVTAAPFENDRSENFGDGMEKSWREIGICAGLVAESHGTNTPVFQRVEGTHDRRAYAGDLRSLRTDCRTGHEP